jgi:prevent-host-death family protein
MTKRIGIRELKNNTSKIVRAVREERAEYVVTVRGEPVAVLRPLAEEKTRKYSKDEVDRLMAELGELAERVSKAWKSPLSAVEAVQEQRRDL